LSLPDLRQRGPFLLTNTAAIGPGLRLPLRRVGSISGDAGHGPSAPNGIPSEHGLIVSRRGCISLFSHDGSRELWRREMDGWSSTLFRIGDQILHGPVAGHLTSYDIRTGATALQVPFEGIAGLEGVTGESYLIRNSGAREVIAIDHGGSVLWRRSSSPSHVVSGVGTYVLSEELGRRIVRLDARTGEVVWTFEIPDDRAPEAREERPPFVSAGLPSVALIGREVILLTTSPRVYRLGLDRGEVLASAQPPVWGVYLVTESSIYFKQPHLLSEFDHRQMREASRVEYRTELESLYGAKERMVAGFWLTEASIVWTTMQGSLMGASRDLGSDGKRRFWAEDVGGLMPLGVPPSVFRDYLYCAPRATGALYCYQGTPDPA
jgi:hypothetical protein